MNRASDFSSILGWNLAPEFQAPHFVCPGTYSRSRVTRTRLFSHGRATETKKKEKKIAREIEGDAIYLRLHMVY